MKCFNLKTVPQPIWVEGYGDGAELLVQPEGGDIRISVSSDGTEESQHALSQRNGIRVKDGQILNLRAPFLKTGQDLWACSVDPSGCRVALEYSET